MSDRDDFGAFMIGFIIGGLTGAAVSLLLAPQSVRRRVRSSAKKAIELGNQASETVDQAYARAEAAAKDARLRAMNGLRLPANAPMSSRNAAKWFSKSSAPAWVR